MPDQEKMLVELNQVEATKSEIEWESVSYNERKKVGRPRKSLTDSYEYIYSWIEGLLLKNFDEVESAENQRADTISAWIMRNILRVPYYLASDTNVISKRSYKSNDPQEFFRALSTVTMRLCEVMSIEFDENLVAPTACLFFSDKKIPMITSSHDCQAFINLRWKKGKKHLKTMAQINPIIWPLMDFVLWIVKDRGYSKTEEALEEMIKESCE